MDVSIGVNVAGMIKMAKKRRWKGLVAFMFFIAVKHQYMSVRRLRELYLTGLEIMLKIGIRMHGTM